MTQPICLTQYGMMAERHWREFLPNRVQKLESQGSLLEALYEAQETTLDEMELLTRRLEKDGLTPQEAHDQAWETVREKYILLPSESNES